MAIDCKNGRSWCVRGFEFIVYNGCPKGEEDRNVWNEYVVIVRTVHEKLWKPDSRAGENAHNNL